MLGVALHDDRPGFENVGAVGDPERHVGVLLDEEDRLHNLGARPRLTSGPPRSNE